MTSEAFINDYLSSDHRRLDLLLDNLRKAIEQQRPKEYIQSVFSLFQRGMLRHMHWEESVLFPIYDEQVTKTHASTDILKAEHKELATMLEELEDSIEEGMSLEYVKGLEHFVYSHHLREEEILYPVIDAMTQDDLQERMAIALSQDFQ